MKPYENPSQSRANDVWRRFVGMFGGDAVERKFGKTPPPEWVGAIGRLTDMQLERGMRRLLHSGAATVPTLPAFVKLCRVIGDDDFGVEERPALPAPPDIDPWLAAGNLHLLGHIRTTLAKDPWHYGKPPNAEMVQRLVKAKNAWVADMQDIAQSDGVPVDLQHACWRDYIGAAESAL